MPRALLPLQEKPLTPRQAADCLRGLAEMLETYPAASVLLSLDVTIAQSEPVTRSKRKSSGA